MAQKGILKKTMAVTLAMTMCWAALSVQGFAAKTPADEDAAAINLVETDTSSGDDIVIDIPDAPIPVGPEEPDIDIPDNPIPVGPEEPDIDVDIPDDPIPVGPEEPDIDVDIPDDPSLDPETPEEPLPEEPVEPEQPDVPPTEEAPGIEVEIPDDPIPVAPAVPVKPAKPAAPVKPAAPASPAEPAEPAEPVTPQEVAPVSPAPGETVDIPEEDTPLADVSEPGGISPVYLVLGIALCGGGLMVLLGRRKQDEA